MNLLPLNLKTFQYKVEVKRSSVSSHDQRFALL